MVTMEQGNDIVSRSPSLNGAWEKPSSRLVRCDVQTTRQTNQLLYIDPMKEHLKHSSSDIEKLKRLVDESAVTFQKSAARLDAIESDARGSGGRPRLDRSPKEVPSGKLSGDEVGAYKNGLCTLNYS